MSIINVVHYDSKDSRVAILSFIWISAPSKSNEHHSVTKSQSTFICNDRYAKKSFTISKKKEKIKVKFTIDSDWWSHIIMYVVTKFKCALPATKFTFVCWLQKFISSPVTKFTFVFQFQNSIHFTGSGHRQECILYIPQLSQPW